MFCDICSSEFRGGLCWLCYVAGTHGISKITPGIYLADNVNSRDYDKLQRLGIHQILTVGIDLLPHKTDVFRTSKIDVSDVENENISMYFNTANKFIDQGVTLVHCRAGVSRSASIVVAYLMKTYGWNLDRALSYVKSKRSIINPNKGFLQQLKNYDVELQKKERFFIEGYIRR